MKSARAWANVSGSMKSLRSFALAALCAWFGAHPSAVRAGTPEEDLRVVRTTEIKLRAKPNATPADHERLTQLYRQLAARHLDSAEVQVACGLFAWDDGQPAEAVQRWRAAQRITPRNPQAANYLGGAEVKLGNMPAAAEQFARATEADGENPLYHFNLANVEFLFRHDLATAWQLTELDLLHRALAEYRRASRLAPTQLEYARAYAETFYAMPDADWNEALAAWQHVLSLSNDRGFAYLQLVRVSLKQGRKAQALDFLAKISSPGAAGLKEKLRKQAESL